MIWWTLAFILLWTAVSVWWFIVHLGDKWRKDTVIDVVLAPPALLLALVFGLIYSRKRHEPVDTSTTPIQDRSPWKKH